MIPKEVLTQELNALEAEYRYWVVEAIRMGRGIDSLEEEIDQYDSDLGPERVAEFRLRLARTREKHQEIEAKIRFIRQRLDELRMRLGELP